MTLVLDASAIGSILLPEEEAHILPGLTGTLARDGAIVPGHWPAEVVNLLLTAQHRERLTELATRHALRTLGSMQVEVDGGDLTQLGGAIWGLAERHRLTIYDAAYLELASRRGLPLATNYKALMRAAAAEHVELFGR